MIYYGFDCLSRLLLLYSIFLPLSRVCSLDSYFSKGTSRQKEAKKKKYEGGEVRGREEEIEGESRGRRREKCKEEKDFSREEEMGEEEINREGGEEEDDLRDDEEQSVLVCSGASFAFIVQIILVYVITFVRKYNSSLEWQNGLLASFTLILFDSIVAFILKNSYHLP